jgi:hypothetical protein
MTRDPAARDALALITCELRGDTAGADVILGGCDLREVAKVLAQFSADGLRLVSRRAPDAMLVKLTREHLLKLADDS